MAKYEKNKAVKHQFFLLRGETGWGGELLLKCFNLSNHGSTVEQSPELYARMEGMDVS